MNKNLKRRDDRQDRNVGNKRNETRYMIIGALLLAFAIVTQLVGRFYPEVSRMFVGPIINAIILLAVYFATPKYGFIVAFLTPILAYLTGQLPSPMLPIVPFIIVSNLIYAFCYALFRKNTVERTLSGIVGSFLKYGFLLLAVKFVIPMIGINFSPEVQNKIGVAFGTVQLLAALIGVAIAVVITDITNRILRQERYSRKI